MHIDDLTFIFFNDGMVLYKCQVITSKNIIKKKVDGR